MQIFSSRQGLSKKTKQSVALPNPCLRLLTWTLLDTFIYLSDLLSFDKTLSAAFNFKLDRKYALCVFFLKKYIYIITFGPFQHYMQNFNVNLDLLTKLWSWAVLSVCGNWKAKAASRDLEGKCWCFMSFEAKAFSVLIAYANIPTTFKGTLK